MRAWRLVAAAAALVLSMHATAQSAQVVDLPTRPGVQERLLVLRPAGEVASVLLLLTGGVGQLGIADDGSLARGGNFLVRSRQLFVERGHAVVLVDTPSDHAQLLGSFRDTPEHAADLGAAVAWARRTFSRPVWLVGTSRGTHSVANGGIRLQGDQAPDGLVFTSTVLGSSRRAPVTARPVQDWPLEQLHVPVLVMHHEDDTCGVCAPQQLPELMRKLRPGASKLVTYAGGRSEGPPCEALAHHGFNGQETQVVDDMSAWIRSRR